MEQYIEVLNKDLEQNIKLLSSDCPCFNCEYKTKCTEIEKRFCCKYCEWFGGGDCDECSSYHLGIP